MFDFYLLDIIIQIMAMAIHTAESLFFVYGSCVLSPHKYHTNGIRACTTSNPGILEIPFLFGIIL